MRLVKIALLLLIVSPTWAQEEVIVEPTEAGALNNIILGDTIAGGVRRDPNAVYVLRRNAVYKLTAEIRNPGYSLTIRAEDGPGSRPIIMPSAASGGDSQRPFTAQGDLTLEGVYVTCYNDLGGFADRIIRVNISNVRINLSDCWFDGAGQSIVRSDTDGNSVFMENCIVSHAGNAFNPNNGRIVDFRQNGDTLLMANNTFYNVTSRIMRLSDGFTVRFANIHNNTIVNTGQVVADLGELAVGFVRDNIIINGGFLGDVRSSALFQYDELSDAAEAQYALEGITQQIHVYNNWFHYDNSVMKVWQDTILRRDDLFDDDMFPFLRGPDGSPIDSATLYSTYTFTNDIQLKNSPGMSEQVLKGMIIDQLFAQNIDNGSSPNWGFTNSPFFKLINGDLEIPYEFPYDFSYSATEAAATLATDGGQLGDRNWELETFNLVLNTETPENDQVFYPNPATNTINLLGSQQITSFRLLSLDGKLIIEQVNVNQPIDVSQVVPGAYIVVATTANGENKKQILFKR